jgi:hypothetical protein
MGSPYGPDMPPVTGYTYPTTGGPTNRGNVFYTSVGGNQFPDAVPRLFPTTQQRKGGYFIDQNSNWPTREPNYDTVAETGGVCTLCHGGDVDNMDYYTGSTLWRGGQINGHSNSTLGGNGVSARNIFDGRRAASNYMAVQNGVNVTRFRRDGGRPPHGGVFSGAKPADNSGSGAPPRNTGWYGNYDVGASSWGTTVGATSRGSGYSSWYSGVTTATDTGSIGSDGSSNPAESRAHSFTCSKCHTPHASHLPALLITNCLDEGNSNWADSSGRVGVAGNHAQAPNVRNNCHRKVSTTSGWNRLAPGQ